ncbi:hypothetical protein HY949_05390 [Candidatus Gottesmanbacteria bacterium]|nr:hypothetical protein [Candidatus Gottesmanbacteria bacterium]
MTIVGFLSALASITYTLSVYFLDITILGPLYSLRTPISVLIGLAVFRESVDLYQVLIIIGMTVAGIFVSMDERFSLRSFFRKPIAFAIMTITLSAIYNASLKYAAGINGYWTTVAWFNILNQVFLLVTIPLFWGDFLKQSVQIMSTFR